MAAAELATVFVETSLGTRLVVSFPASATTVADLKRQLAAEHAVCFPQSGPIAVKSLKVKHDGSLFRLTDSVVVESAFRWVQGPWNLLVEARELGSHPLACEDADCGTGGSEQNSDNPVISDSTRSMSLPAVSRGGGNLAIGAGVSDTPLLNQLAENHGVVECDSNQLEDGNTVPQESSDDICLAAGGSGTSSMDQQDRSHEGVVKHAMDQQTVGIVKGTLQECSGRCLPAGGSDNEKAMLQESTDLGLVAGESDSRAKNLQNKSHEDAKRAFCLCKDANAKIMLQGSSSLDVAAGEDETPSMNQQDNSYNDVKHDLEQHKSGNVKATFQETNSDLDVAGSEGENSPMNQLDKSYENVKHASGQGKDDNINTMPKESSRLDESAAGKDNGRLQNQQQGVIAEPRDKELFHNQKRDKNDESIIGNCDGKISFLASSTVNVNLAEGKRRIEPENLNSNAMAYNQGNCSHDMGEKPSPDHKEPWTSEVCNGETSNSVSDIPPCVHSMDRDNSLNREANASDEDESWVTGLYSGESSFKETGTPHCIESMKEGNKRQAYNHRFLKKRKSEGTEHESYSKIRRHRILIVRKLPMSKATKIYGVRC